MAIRMARWPALRCRRRMSSLRFASGALSHQFHRINRMLGNAYLQRDAAPGIQNEPSCSFRRMWWSEKANARKGIGQITPVTWADVALLPGLVRKDFVFSPSIQSSGTVRLNSMPPVSSATPGVDPEAEHSDKSAKSDKSPLWSLMSLLSLPASAEAAVGGLKAREPSPTGRPMTITITNGDFAPTWPRP